MRFGGGALILSVLIGVAVMLMLQGKNATQVNSARKIIQPKVEQVSGEGFADSYRAEMVEVNGKPHSIKIVKLDPTGPLATYYKGIKIGDEIIEVGPMAVKDSDPELMLSLLKEAGSRSSGLKILRDGQSVELTCRGPLTDQNAAKGLTGEIPSVK